MMELHRNLLSEAVRYGLTAGAVGLLSATAAPAFAQSDDDDASTLDRIVVTGSRIKRAEIEGPNPITVITRADLEVKGDLSVADVLRSSTFNTLGSFVQSSGNTAQSQATINLRGIGSNYTLVLLDGRRVAGSPVLGAAVQNLNTIPFAAVERIEILRGGASAVYGSDAVGGVVNIILRKDYEGLQLTMGVERPTRGEPDGNLGSISGGVSSDRGNLTFVIDHQDRDIFFNSDRPTGIPGLDPAVGLSAFGFPGSAYVYGSTDGTRSGPFLGSFADPRCPTALGSDPLFPNSVLVQGGYGTLCYFNYAAVSANEASLRRDSLMVNGNFEITDNISAFARATYSNSESFGRYAATPITGPFPTISGSNPNNPFGGDALLLLRFVAGGNRDSNVTDNNLDLLAGVRGSMDLFGGSSWELGVHHNRYKIDSVGTGYLIRQQLQPLIDSGVFNPFGDPRDPAFRAAVGRVSHTILQNSESRFMGVDGQLNFDLFEMANGPVSFATGFDYRDEFFADLVDAQSAAGNVAGTAGGNASGERAAYAIFAEAYIPILSNLALDIAVRRDHYNDFGNATSPKVSLEFRPMDSLLIRGSWGEGFRAPSLQQLNQSPQQSFNAGRDIAACNGLIPFSAPFNPCNPRQYESSTGGNPNLRPEESENWGVGFVWSPIDRLNITMDWYDIELDQQIAPLALQTILNLEGSSNPSDRALVAGLVQRNPNTGAITLIRRTPLNLSGFKTDGIDASIEYAFDTEVGTWRQRLDYSYINSFETEGLPGTGFGDAITGSGFVPDTRASLTLGWTYGDFGASAIADMIGDSEQSVTAGGNTVTVRIPHWTTWNLQGTWNTPWQGKVTLGVRNITDKAPPLDNRIISSPFYLNSQYNFLGRVPYVRYEQKF